MTIIDTARELIGKAEAHEAIRHICEYCDADNIAKVCRALIQRTEALRELADAADKTDISGGGVIALQTAAEAARRALADD